jgi:tRNA-splicing ligase RtcB
MYTSSDGKIKTWIDWTEIESGTIDQIKYVATHPHLNGHVAVMPDTHLGVGVPIGTILPTKQNIIIPNAVGVDIGCGISYVKTPYRLTGWLNEDFWKLWESHVRELIPVGFSHHANDQPIPDMFKVWGLNAPDLQKRADDRAWHQLGTLGGGNHFIEALRDVETDTIWLAVHSGSRNIGHTIASFYAEAAKDYSDGKGVSYPKDLAYLDTSKVGYGSAYARDMQWAISYASENRYRMMQNMVKALTITLQYKGLERAEYTDLIRDVPHNYAVQEETANGLSWVHRKGAMTPVPVGFIPGSMGTKSYVVTSKRVADAYNSSSHGAGRTMGRNVAKRSIGMDEFMLSLEGTYSRASRETLDEAPGAYKDIDRVMENQADLVTILHTLRPIITIKGDTKAAE